MVRNVAPLVRELEDEDFYLLSGIEHGMRFSEWVNREKLPEYSGLDREEVGYRLDRCMDLELIQRQTIQYEGYQLLFEGYDVLALRAFAEQDVISGVGAPLGEGKESDVREVQNGQPLALKFHREGLTNFRRVDRERDYTSDRAHVSWLYTARKAAEREFEVMEALATHARVPEPVHQNRHGIVMERLDGVELSRARLAEDSAPIVLGEILQELANVWSQGYVHTDMSEYNVFIDDDSLWIIDWPQAVATDHPNAPEFLARDIRNVIGYFRRKHPGMFEDDPVISDIVSRVQQDSIDEWAAASDI